MKKLIFIILMLAMGMADADHCTTDTDCMEKHPEISWEYDDEIVLFCAEAQIEMYESIGLTQQDCDRDFERFVDVSDADTVEEYENDFHNFVLMKVVKYNQHYGDN